MNRQYLGNGDVTLTYYQTPDCSNLDNGAYTYPSFKGSDSCNSATDILSARAYNYSSCYIPKPIPAPTKMPRPYSYVKMVEGVTTTTLKFFSKNDCAKIEVNGEDKLVCPI